MKRIIVLILMLTLIISGCSTSPKNANDTQSFTDDLGRTVELPSQIDKVAPSGNPSQILLFTLAPNKMVGWARKPSKDQAKYIGEKYMTLPEFGAFYGKKGNLNMEALITAKPQVVIDFGEKKDGIKEDLDRLQEKIGIPVIFVEGDITAMGNAYRKIGKLLELTERGEKLAQYCESIIDDINEKSQQVTQKKTIYYGEGDQGLEAFAAGNIHSRVIEMIGAVNVANIKMTKGKGGNLIDVEQLINWQPDIMIFNGNAYQYAKDDELFNSLNAPIYEVPNALYNWMGRPPSINQLLGLYWLGNLVYPDIYNVDINDVTKTFYSTMFNYDLTDQEINDLLINSK